MEIEAKLNTVLTAAQAPNGFLATAEIGDNYQRVWSRDSAILALAILVEGKTEFFQRIKNTVYALQTQQSAIGIIPSNIAAENALNSPASYGSLVGRVDATSWWIIQAMSFVEFTQDETAKTDWKQSIYKALDVLKCWEFNERQLIYTPIGGNWADEYVSNGYTLYDNLLRFWAVKLVAKVYNDNSLKTQSVQIQQAIHANFNPNLETNSRTLHPRIHEAFQTQKLHYWPSSFSPMNYDLRWDMAANALALLLGFNNDSMFTKCESLFMEYKHWMLPVFHPVIHPVDSDWTYLAQNYNYNFKNFPNQFHNGGSWPVMLGLFCTGLAQSKQGQLAKLIRDEYHNLLIEKDDFQFHEYYDPINRSFGGMKQMCFSAAGWLLMKQAQKDNIEISKIL